MGNLEGHARDEMNRIGLFDADADYGGMIGKAVMELVGTFARQGHSGFSARQTLAVFDRVARFQTLAPLTSSPSEWMEVGDDTWQSLRQSSCFSSDGGGTYHDIDEPPGPDGKRVVHASEPARPASPDAEPAAPVEDVRRDTAVRINIIAVQREDGTPGVRVEWVAAVNNERLGGGYVCDPTDEHMRAALVSCWNEYQAERDERDAARSPAEPTRDG